MTAWQTYFTVNYVPFYISKSKKKKLAHSNHVLKVSPNNVQTVFLHISIERQINLTDKLLVILLSVKICKYYFDGVMIKFFKDQ